MSNPVYDLILFSLFFFLYLKGTSVQGRLVRPIDLVAGLPTDQPTVFAFGAMAHGKIEPDYVSFFLFQQSTISSFLSPRVSFVSSSLSPNYACAQVEEYLSFSDYPLSAMCALNRLFGAFELFWNIM